MPFHPPPFYLCATLPFHICFKSYSCVCIWPSPPPVWRRLLQNSTCLPEGLSQRRLSLARPFFNPICLTSKLCTKPCSLRHCRFCFALFLRKCPCRGDQFVVASLAILNPFPLERRSCVIWSPLGGKPQAPSWQYRVALSIPHTPTQLFTLQDFF